MQARPPLAHDQVSVIIPVRDRTQVLATCLDSLAALPRPPGEVVIVDDGGGDPALATLVDEHPRVRLVRLPDWQGAAAARNAGVDQARGAVLWFLDSDSVVDDAGALDAGLALLSADPQRGAVGGEAVVEDGRRWLQLKQLRPNGSAWTTRHDPDTVRERPVDYLPTCACLVRRSAFQTVGGFDPAYRFLSEDTDLCVRLWRWGFTVLADGRCAVLHDQRHGRGQGDLALMLRNELRFSLVHMPPAVALTQPWHQLRFVLSPRTRQRLASGAPGVTKHLPGGVGGPLAGASLAAVGLRYARGLAGAWVDNARELGETLRVRRELDREAPRGARWPVRGG